MVDKIGSELREGEHGKKNGNRDIREDKWDSKSL